MLKNVIDLKNSITFAKKKCEDLNISITFKNPIDFVNSYEDNEGNEMVVVNMEEPEKEEPEVKLVNKKSKTSNNNNSNNNSGTKVNVKSIEKSTHTEKENAYIPYFEMKKDQSNKAEKPKVTELKDHNTEGSSPDKQSSRADLLKTAPVVSFFPGLFYWDKSEIDLGNGVEREHRFLGNSDAPILETKNMNEIFLRQTYYQSDPNFNPAKRDEEKMKKLQDQKKQHSQILKTVKTKSNVRSRLKKRLG